MYVVKRTRPTRFVFFQHLRKAEVHNYFSALMLKFVLLEMYNYILIKFRPLLLGASLQLGALSARLVRLWVNPALY